MKKIILFLFLWSGGDNPPGPISQANRSILAEDYFQAIKSFETARDRYPDKHVEISFNLGILYAGIDSTSQAASAFRMCLGDAVTDPFLGSEAYNNMGVVLVNLQQPVQALEMFRQSMRLNPGNQVARLNYELLARLLPPPKANTPPPPASPPDDNDTLPPEQQNESSSGTLDEEYIQRIEDRLKRWRRFVGTSDASRTEPYEQISLEQAQRILEDMRSNEARFLQQLRKAPTNITPASDRPDW